jgi:hypothetical protein
MRYTKNLFLVLLLSFSITGLLFGQMTDRLGRTPASDIGAVISSMMPVTIGDSVVDSMGNLYLFDNTFTQGTGRTFTVKTKITQIPSNGTKPFAAEFDGAFSAFAVGANAIYALRGITTFSSTTASSALSLVAITPGLKLASVDLTGRAEIKVVPGSTDRIYLFQGLAIAGMGALLPARSLKVSTFDGKTLTAPVAVNLP